MSSQTFAPYKHSGRFDLSNLVAIPLVAVAAAIPLGFAYAYLDKWIPFIYLRVLVTVGYGIVFGMMGTWLLKRGRVRNNIVALLGGAFIGLVALYFQWNGYVHTLAKGAPPFLFPDSIWQIMQLLLKDGTWSIRGSGNVTGVMLALVWIVEAGIIVGFSALAPFGTISSTPYCETTRCWLDEERKINTLEAFTDPAQIAALKRDDLGPLLQAKPRLPDSKTFARITLKHSPQCKIFHTLRLDNITTEIDKEGKVNETATQLLRDLVLPASMFELITKFENFAPPAPASAAPPPPPAQA